MLKRAYFMRVIVLRWTCVW